ncbi:MAG: hypothetical protein PHT16_01060 [Candidatus Pacebacteria bacterium]|nr:hypothetical protein [Candidatus Paceibacterota bacterium]
MKKILSIFASAFILNVIWENLHSVFYANYMGGKITEIILLRASLADALIVAIITLPFIFYSPLKNKSWLIIFIGIIISIFIEYWGLGTGRWAYNSLMPIIPVLGTGLTPTVQLGLLGYVSFKIAEYLN